MSDKNIGGKPDVLSVMSYQERKWMTWHISEIYKGTGEKNKSVPKVNDHVIDDTGDIVKYYKVTHVDDVTKLSTLKPLKTRADIEKEEYQGMRGVGPGYQSEIWRCLHNTNVRPFTLRPDDLLHAYTGEYYKLFLGTEISKERGVVISQYQDLQTGNISENVPLVQLTDDNSAVKVPVICTTGYNLQDGEVVTMVTYSAEGTAISINRLLIYRTNDVRRLEQQRRQVREIELITSYLSKTEDKLLEFPNNIAKEQLHLVCRVSYVDGTYKDISIDGGRCNLLGLDQYQNTTYGKEVPMVLTYTLSDDEDSLAPDTNSVGNKRHISVTYTARTVRALGAYTVSLFPIIKWVEDNWEIDWYLYNLDRNINYKVTNLVRAGANTKPINTRRFGVTQRAVMSVELSQIDPSLVVYNHVQTFDFAFMGEGNMSDTPYYITYSVGQDPIYGQDLVATYTQDGNTGRYDLNLTFGCSEQSEWLDRIYYRIQPLYNRMVESKPPKPTHFNIITTDGGRTEYPIENWNSTISTTQRLVTNETLAIEWLYKTDDSTLYLGISGITLRRS